MDVARKDAHTIVARVRAHKLLHPIIHVHESTLRAVEPPLHVLASTLFRSEPWDDLLVEGRAVAQVIRSTTYGACPLTLRPWSKASYSLP